MINLHERMLPTSAGVEPATSWSPVGRRIQMSHRGRQLERDTFYLHANVTKVRSREVGKKYFDLVVQTANNVYLNKPIKGQVAILLTHQSFFFFSNLLSCPRCDLVKVYYEILRIVSTICPVSILRKSISGRHRPVRVADGPMTVRCRFT